jgi:hypothetical protein
MQSGVCVVVSGVAFLGELSPSLRTTKEEESSPYY